MQKRLVQTLTLLAAAVMSWPAQAQPSTGRPDYWHYGWDWDWGWGHMLFGSLMMVLFWGAIIFVIVLVVRSLSGGTSEAAGLVTRKRSLDVLQERFAQERFARGEIDKGEFDERKRVLSG